MSELPLGWAWAELARGLSLITCRWTVWVEPEDRDYTSSGVRVLRLIRTSGDGRARLTRIQGDIPVPVYSESLDAQEATF